MDFHLPAPDSFDQGAGPTRGRIAGTGAYLRRLPCSSLAGRTIKSVTYRHGRQGRNSGVPLAYHSSGTRCSLLEPFDSVPRFRSLVSRPPSLAALAALAALPRGCAAPAQSNPVGPISDPGAPVQAPSRGSGTLIKGPFRRVSPASRLLYGPARFFQRNTCGLTPNSARKVRLEFDRSPNPQSRATSRTRAGSLSRSAASRKRAPPRLR